MDVNPDLVRERRKASFKIEEATDCLYGGRYHKVEALVNRVVCEPVLDNTDCWYLDGEARYLRACQRALAFVRIARELKIQRDVESLEILETLVGDDMFIFLHLTMFRTALESLADDEQLGWWLEKCVNFEILGTYAQTELAHGSNVAGLRTTATLDRKTDEWVLQTPCREAVKWWPGGLAHSTTHCILMARVIIDGKDHGVNAFMFQHRNLENHVPTPGVTLFSLGSKMGYNGMDNGGMWLEQVRIPRRWLLGRYVSVDREGRFQIIGDMRMLYLTMTFTRQQIIKIAGYFLAKACVIATRYSAVRRQFPSLQLRRLPKGTEIGKVEEAQVLDYKTQQMTVFTQMASAIAFTFAGRWCTRLYERVLAHARNGDFSGLADVHIATSALKASFTRWAADGIEALRKACGGNGFLLSSGVALTYLNYVPQATYEGDFVVLSIQAGRGLLKAVAQAFRGSDKKSEEGKTGEGVFQQGSAEKPAVHYQYLLDCNPLELRETQMPSAEERVDFRDLDYLVRLFKQRTCAFVYSCAERAMEEEKLSKTPMARLDDVKFEFTKITLAHAQAVTLENFLNVLRSETTKSMSSFHLPLKRLCTLYALSCVEQNFGDFLIARTLHPDHYRSLLDVLMEVLEELRPDMVSIADAWRFPDFVLNSALGRYDGRVYDALLESTKLTPSSKYLVHPAYHDSIQYIVHPERWGKTDHLLYSYTPIRLFGTDHLETVSELRPTAKI